MGVAVSGGKTGGFTVECGGSTRSGLPTNIPLWAKSVLQNGINATGYGT